MKIRAVRFASIAWLCAGMLSWIPLQAAELGFYMGGAYGNSSKDIEQRAFDNFLPSVHDMFGYTPTSTSASFDNEDHGYSFVGGYRLYSWLAVEGGYVGLGEQRYRATSQGSFAPDPDEPGAEPSPSPLTVSTRASTTGFLLSALGILPVSYRWEVYGRVGVMFATNELTLYVTDGVGSYKDKPNSSSTELLAGVGASFAFAEIYGLRAEYQRVFDAGDGTVGEADTDLVTLGVTVKF